MRCVFWQTSDVKQVSHVEVAGRVEAATGSDPQVGLHFTPQQVETEMDLQLAQKSGMLLDLQAKHGCAAASGVEASHRLCSA